MLKNLKNKISINNLISINSMKTSKNALAFALLVLVAGNNCALAQDVLPADNGLEDYHTAPRWRESESHPLRLLAYVVHPIGWFAREIVFRPLSFFASSTEGTRSIMGYREPYDYRQPECFSSDDSVPDCRTVMPFSYNKSHREPVAPQSSVFFPNVNFDFDRHALTTLGKGKVAQVADLLKKDGSVKVVLQGHSDYIGGDKYNQKLGLNRADEVRKELVRLGIPSERLSTVTFGETQPLINEKTDAARAVNRRVEVHVDSGDMAGSVGTSAEYAPKTATSEVY